MTDSDYLKEKMTNWYEGLEMMREDVTVLPEKRLTCALLDRAYKDATADTSIKSSYAVSEKRKADAIEWLTEETGEGAFGWCFNFDLLQELYKIRREIKKDNPIRIRSCKRITYTR